MARTMIGRACAIGHIVRRYGIAAPVRMNDVFPPVKKVVKAWRPACGHSCGKFGDGEDIVRPNRAPDAGAHSIRLWLISPDGASLVRYEQALEAAGAQGFFVAYSCGRTAWQRPYPFAV